MMIGISLSLTAARGGPALGPELRGTGTTGRTSTAGSTAADATYDTATGAGTASRVASGDQTFVQFTGLASASIYRLDIHNTGSAAMYARQSNGGGTILQTINAGASVTVDLSTGAGTGLFLTALAAVASVSFTVNSLRKLG